MERVGTILVGLGALLVFGRLLNVVSLLGDFQPALGVVVGVLGVFLIDRARRSKKGGRGPDVPKGEVK